MTKITKKILPLTLTLLFFAASSYASKPMESDSILSSIDEKSERPSCILALRTNLLYDLLATPNIEVEVPFGRQSRWSMMAEYWCPWYKWDNNGRAYQLQVFGLEMRYWVTKRSKMKRPHLSGSFFGAYYANGEYDLEWNGKGDQGEFNSVGMTYGYSWRLARNFNLEASVSAGYLWGPRRHYEIHYGDHLIWKYTGSVNYFGPTKLKVSLVWLLGKRGGSRQTKGGGQ